MRPLLRRSSSLISVRGRFLDGPDAGLEWLVGGCGHHGVREVADELREDGAISVKRKT